MIMGQGTLSMKWKLAILCWFCTHIFHDPVLLSPIVWDKICTGDNNPQMFRVE